jgi:hypothetical protein
MILLVFFLGCGLVMARHVFAKEGRYVRFWAGSLLGLLGLMWMPVPFAFWFGFSYLSHFCGAAVMLCLAFLVSHACPFQPGDTSRAFKTNWPLAAAAAGIGGFIILYMFLRTFVPQGGGYCAGLPNFGDMPFHLGIISGIAEQKVFPPEYSIFSGVRMAYPFLVDSLSSSLVLFGMPLRWAFLVPNFLLAGLVVVGFMILAREAVQRTASVVLSAVLFFFNGGFGFVYFLEGFKKDPEVLARLVKSSYYSTPTWLWEHNIFLGQAIGTCLVNQRTTLAGWAMLFFILWMLYRGITRRERRLFLAAGIVAGLLPMVHSVSFLILAVIACVWFVVYFFTAEDRRSYVAGWAAFLVPAVLLSLPQFWVWIVPHQAYAAGKFMRFHFNWANEQDPWLWFWIKNAGLLFLLAWPALLSAGRKKLLFYLPAVAVFLFGDLVVLSQIGFDNNKVFYPWYVFTAILVADFLVEVYGRMKGLRGRGVFLGGVIFFCTFSTALTFVHDLAPGQCHEIFSAAQVRAAEFIKNNTPSDALFISADFTGNPVTGLAGRSILSGYYGWMLSFGLDYKEREKDIMSMYTQPQMFSGLQKKYGIDYVYFSGWERLNYKADPGHFDAHYPRIYSQDDISIYAVSPRFIARTKAYP